MSTHNGNLATKLVLDVALLDGVRGLILDDGKESFNAHLGSILLQRLWDSVVVVWRGRLGDVGEEEIVEVLDGMDGRRACRASRDVNGFRWTRWNAPSATYKWGT